MIPITKPFLPPREEYEHYLQSVWNSGWLTNMGALGNQLEERLKDYLGVRHLLYVSSGTIGLQMAIKALELKGEIITTPFSFVATSSSIVWEGCTPVFADIDETLNASPRNIEALINNNTSAILVTHIFGNPCDVEALQNIATRHNIKLIYDAAHAFGVGIGGNSIFNYGDISVCSLHATKFYHSTEGGFIVTNDEKLYRKLAYMRNFGFDGPERFAELGINAKNSEFHAAMGLVNLNYVDKIITRNKQITDRYESHLQQGALPLYKRGRREAAGDLILNYSYYPIIFPNEKSLLKCIDILNKNDVYPRRYFYPTLPTVLPYVQKKAMPVADDISKRILCLPKYYELTDAEIDMICELIKQSFK